jgi:hypothetical protein
MNTQPKPPQFTLGGLFKLTTWVAVLAAVYAVLPGGAREVVVTMLLLVAIAAAVLVAEIVVIVPTLVLGQRVVDAALRAMWFIVPLTARRRLVSERKQRTV